MNKTSVQGILAARAAGFAPSGLRAVRGKPGETVSLELVLEVPGFDVRGRVVGVDGRPVETMGELQRLLVGERIGASVTFTVARHERVLDIAVIPNELAA